MLPSCFNRLWRWLLFDLITYVWIVELARFFFVDILSFRWRCVCVLVMIFVTRSDLCDLAVEVFMFVLDDCSLSSL